MVLKKDKEREKASKLIHDEARKISAMFLRLSHATNPKVINSPQSGSIHLLTLSLSLPVHPGAGDAG